MKKIKLNKFLILVLFFTFFGITFAEGTRLLRQPDMYKDKVVFTYGSDIWISNIDGKNVKRLTSTPAIESNPHFSPDGKLIAFSSNRSGISSVYVVPVEGGTPKRLTWYSEGCKVRGWTNDGKNVLYSSVREAAPSRYSRLWTVPVNGGPSVKLFDQWGYDAAFSPDGKKLILDKMHRWDVEWRAYRGGQNTPLIIIDLEDLSETLLPNERTTDIKPVWSGNKIYFLSDRDWVMNIWSYDPATKELNQVTKFKGSDIKWLSEADNKLAYERDGYIHIYDTQTAQSKQLNITVIGDFPWAEPKWEDVTKRISSVSLSPTGKRVLMQSRGEIFTVPVKHGDTRNITKSSDAADRAPIWSPKGGKIAWFSDKGFKDYKLYVADQDGVSNIKTYDIGKSKLGWTPVWSPDGKYIAFVDDDVRVRLLELESGDISTIGVGGNNLERGRNGLTWSPDSKMLAYSKAAENNFRQIIVYSLETEKSKPVTNKFADSFSPVWDRNGKNMYFLASTDVALASGWANTSSMSANPTYAAYVINLDKNDKTPFFLRSDEEKEAKEKSEKKPDKKKDKEKKDEKTKIDFEDIERRIISLPMPVRNYRGMIAGPKGSVFISESVPQQRGLTLHKFALDKRKAVKFAGGVGNVSVSADGKKIIVQQGPTWKVAGTAAPLGKGGDIVKTKLRMKIDRLAEWKQIFEEAWRYQRDYFYDPGMHGRDWKVVYDRYSPLINYVKHRSDLNYLLDMMNGELSVGHSFVFGGDMPKTDKNTMGLLGADLVIENGYWKVERIFTTESWNPKLSSPLDKPGLKIDEGNYIVEIDGNKVTGKEDIYKYLDGTSGKQTIIKVNDKPQNEGSWKITVKPISSERGLRKRGWVEDNRRMVEKLSDGKLAYVWVPNTGGGGYVSFNRYYFAQQDKLGAVIDERFNGGGLLDDYMVDLMTRSLRAAITNEVPNGKAFRLPAGILGPKVLLINELAGSGGDFFPWVFRQQNAGPLIGQRTWGGLVKSSVHYAFIDGGAMTTPDNAVFDPVKNEWVGENIGIHADIEVRQDAKSLKEGRDPQLERAVKETLKLLKKRDQIKVTPPPFPKPAIKK